MKLSISWSMAATATTLVLLYGSPGIAGASTDTTASAVADIPVGPADENLETSRGLTAILDNCAEAYTKVDNFHSVGTYHVITKVANSDTSHIQSRVTIDYQGPDRIAIHSRSDSPKLRGSFVADGQQVTQVSHSDSMYLVMPQPDSLGAFCDAYRRGEIYEEKSGAMGISVIGPMLMTDDPYAVLHEDIQRYIYEGEEEIDGRECHRVRFVQDDPDVVVNLWIDQETWLVSKASFITSYDDELNRVESFEEGAVANMLIMTLEEATTDPESINIDAFKAEIPRGFSEAEKAKTDPEATKQPGGIWESLVSIAAEDSPEETTWSLTKVTGRTDMRIEKFAELKSTVLEFDQITSSGLNSVHLAAARKNGVVHLLDADGTGTETIDLNMPVSMFAVLETRTSGPLLIVVNGTYTTVSAHDLDGNQLWEYRHPYATVSGMITSTPTTAPEEAVYVTLSGKSGLRKLDVNGKIEWANSRVNYTSGMKPAPPGVDRIMNRGVYEVGILDKKLKPVQVFSTEDDMPSMRWDTEEAVYPLVAVAVSSDSDILLQRRSETGEIAWTTMIAPNAEDVVSSALYWANMRVNGEVTRVMAVLLSDGQVVLATPDGAIVYRGQIDANNALIKRNDDSVVQNMMVADLNGDGVDEIYTRMDNLILKLETP